MTAEEELATTEDELTSAEEELATDELELSIVEEELPSPPFVSDDELVSSLFDSEETPSVVSDDVTVDSSFWSTGALVELLSSPHATKASDVANINAAYVFLFIFVLLFFTLY